MRQTAIRAQNLGKRYQIGVAKASYKTFREAINDIVKAPFGHLRSRFVGASPINNSQTKAIDFIWALRNISFEVKYGEVIGIIGQNGAGKTTLLKMLSRITKPTEGRAEIYGRIGSLLEVGTGFHSELTGRENIYMSGAILGMKRFEIKRKFDEIVAFAEVEKFIDTPVKRYSTGMYLRLAFAVAAHLDPEILIVDEVLAVGDEAFQRKCLGQMQNIANSGRTVLFVSHNLPAIQKLCSYCYVLHKGILIYQGEPALAVNHYLDLFTNEKQLSSSEYTQAGCRIIVTVRDRDGKPCTTWRYGEPLNIEIDIYESHPLSKLAVDIAFYTGAGPKLFAFQSDRLQNTPSRVGDFYHVVFSVENPGVTASEIYFDVALREGNTPYFAKVKGAGRLFPDYSTVPLPIVPNTLLTLRATVTWYNNKSPDFRE